MKGILHLKDNGWIIRYKEESKPFWFEIVLNSSDIIKYSSNLPNLIEKEIEFYIDSNSTAKLDLPKTVENLEIEEALKIFNKSLDEKNKSDWNKIADEFNQTYQIDLENAKFSYLPFLNFLKKNYFAPQPKPE